MTAALDTRDVVFRYGAGGAPAVCGVTLTIQPGEAVGVVGESGSGKTTLGRLLVGALKPTSGSVTVAGRPWAKVRRTDAARRQVQMIFQDPYGSLNPWRTPVQTVSEVLRRWNRIGAATATTRAVALLSEVGLPPDAIRRRPAKLSGGQCQRVGIARALAADPVVLVADEPTSSLDVSVQAQILNLLCSLRQRLGVALVLISHDLSVVRYATERAIVMYGGQVVEEGPTGALLTEPLHPYTRLLVASIPGHDGEADPAVNTVDTSGGCVFARQCPLVGPECLSERPALRGTGRRVACVRVGSAAAPLAGDVLDPPP